MISSKELSIELGKQHSNIKISIKRTFGANMKEIVSVPFTHRGNEYFNYELTDEQADLVRDRLTRKTTHHQVIEPIALKTIEQLLGIDLIRQHRVLNYRIDGYCKETNTAYEIDEEHHYSKGELNSKCMDRQLKIEEELNCKFVRVKI